MSEGTDLDKKISRRDFLKMLGMSVSAVAVSQVLSACERFTPEEMKITYKEIKNGDSLPLYIRGQEKPANINIQYAFPDVDPLQIRQKDGKGVALPFKNGEERVRFLGEIGDPTLYKVTGKNPELSDEITVGVYPKVTGNLISLDGRHNLEFHDNLYAMPVIVANQSYFEDQAPSEINKGEGYKRSDWKDVGHFGNGLIVGTLGEDDRFRVSGYVCDARALALK